MLVHKIDPRHAHFQMGAKLGFGKITLDARPLSSVSIQDEHRRSPQRAEAVKVSWTFCDIYPDGQEMFIDEARGLFVGVRFGFQPNASASLRRGAKVKQQPPLACLCLRERGINVFLPFNSHFRILLGLSRFIPGPQTFSALKASGRPCLGVLEFSVVIPKQILKTQFGSGTSKVRLHSYDHSPLKSGFKGWTDLSILRSLKRSALVPLSSSGFSLIPSSSLTSSAAAMSTNSVPS